MGNTFLQMFMRSAPAALRAVKGFGAKAAPQAVRQVADTVTNPQTYRALASKAENVLQRGLPGQFAGPNFGNIPARFTGLISDVAGMPAGIQRSAQAGMVNRAIQEAAGAVPQLARGAQQYATGALKAPVIGDVIRTGQAVVTSPLQTAIQTGGQFARDPALRREFLKQFGGTSEKAARTLAGGGGINFGQVGSLMRNLQGIGPTALNPLATRTPTTLLGKTGKLFNPLNPLNAGAYLAGGAISAFFPENDVNRGNAELFAYTPGGVIPKLGVTTIFGATPAGPKDESELIRQSNALRDIGQNYTVNGITYDYKTGRALNPPDNIFIPASQSFGGGGSPPPPAPPLPPPPGVSSSGAQAGQQTPIASDVPIGGSFAGGPTYGGAGMSTGAGVPAQRQNVQQRQLSQEVLNAAQQYAAPAGVSLPSFYAGQQQLGRSMEQTGELQRQLKDLGGAMGMQPEALMQWAQANPGLAYRELQRLKGRNR
jgi:hypothetical protein